MHQHEVHLSSDPSNDWRAAQTVASFGAGPNGQPFMVLQATPSGKGRVTFHPDLMAGTGLSVAALQAATERARIENSMRSSSEGTRFLTKPVLFDDTSMGGSHRMQFDSFLETGMSSRVWGHEAASFIQLHKAEAFFNFVKDNLPRAVAHFPEQMGEVGAKLQRAGMPIPATSAPVIDRQAVVQRWDAQQPSQPTVAPNAPRNGGLKA